MRMHDANRNVPCLSICPKDNVGQWMHEELCICDISYEIRKKIGKLGAVHVDIDLGKMAKFCRNACAGVLVRIRVVLLLQRRLSQICFVCLKLDKHFSFVNGEIKFRIRF